MSECVWRKGGRERERESVGGGEREAEGGRESKPKIFVLTILASQLPDNHINITRKAPSCDNKNFKFI